MELIVENEHGSTAVSVELGADLAHHSLADLRMALGLRVDQEMQTTSLAEVGVHRAMVFSATGATTPASALLDAGWRPDHRGRFSVIRPPHRPIDRPSGPERTEVPADPEPPPSIPYSTVIPMLGVSALMALLWSPMFAILSAASAMIPLMRALGPRMMMRRTRRRHREALVAYQESVRVAEEVWAAAVAQWLEAQATGPGAIDRLVAGATLRPWTRRLAADSPLPAFVGRGDLTVDGDDGDMIIEDVPLLVDIDQGMALVGDRSDVLAIARWVGIETAFRFGPADLDLTVITTADRLLDWEWVKWLPGLRSVATEVQPINDACASLNDPAAQHLVIVDGPVPVGPGAFARLLGGQIEQARVLWLGPSVDIPAVCGRSIEVTADGAVRSTNGRANGWAWRLSADEAEEFARFVAPFTDPDVIERVAPLPDSVPLAQLCPMIDGSEAEAEVLAAWGRSRRDQLLAPIGMTADGPLVLDFVADGPHALVAGTTGSGKSELLRSLVVGAAMVQSPEQLSFVLIDFKGGGAFDAVAGLPHVAAVVTDLEPTHAMRALQSLRAELHHREVLLRHHGVSDLADLGPEVTAPPRLLVIVDEFAALADELPTFLDGLVDVARRGRSLGVHLVLATQRPSGVVTAEIRTNTNLRICLRVRDAGDSVDVIDTADAAALPAVPGRAIVTVGGERRRLVQIAYLAGAPLLEARPFSLACESEAAGGEATWLEAVNAVIGRCHPERVRAPWLPPLPSSLLADRLWTFGQREALDASVQPTGSPIGVLDDPDRRIQLPIMWSPIEGSLIVAAADPDRLARTLGTVVAGLALDLPDLEILVLDGTGGRLDRLGVLGSVADVVHHREPERLARAVALLERRRREATEHTAPSTVVVINRWGPVADSLSDISGPDAPLQLARLFGDGSVVGVVGVTSDRELPSKMLMQARRRLVHQLADGNAGLAFDVHPSKMPSGGAAVFDVERGLAGVIADLSDHGLARVAAWSTPARQFSPVRVLGDCMPLSQLPTGTGSEGRFSVPIAFDEDLEPVFIDLIPKRRFVVLGRPGSGRSTAVAAVTASLERLDALNGVVIIDDADQLTADDVGRRIADADAAGRPVVLAASPAAARAFGGWLAPLLGDATVLLLNPSRLDAEAVRVVVPDLSSFPPGRSVLLDRGQAAIVHVAIDRAA